MAVPTGVTVVEGEQYGIIRHGVLVLQPTGKLLVGNDVEMVVLQGFQFGRKRGWRHVPAGMQGF